jgi:hypothetical protein
MTRFRQSFRSAHSSTMASLFVADRATRQRGWRWSSAGLRQCMTMADDGLSHRRSGGMDTGASGLTRGAQEQGGPR